MLAKKSKSQIEHEIKKYAPLSKDVFDPRVDVAFKKLFGAEENRDLLISLINSIVSEEDRVVHVDILNPYNLQDFKKDKLTVLDIKARDTRGQLYNIEMQVIDEDDYDKRALLYWAKMYSGQLKKAGNCSTLKKAIGIHVLNFLSIPKNQQYHNQFWVTNKESGERHFKDFELHTIELAKFANDKMLSDELKDYLGKVKTSLDRWAMFLTKHFLLDANSLPKELEDPAIKKALGALTELNFTDEERDAYESHSKWLMMEANGIRKVERESFAKGEAKGIAKGIAKEKAKAHKKAIAAAKDMLTDSVDIKKISKYTGLTEKEIRVLK